MDISASGKDIAISGTVSNVVRNISNASSVIAENIVEYFNDDCATGHKADHCGRDERDRAHLYHIHHFRSFRLTL